MFTIIVITPEITHTHEAEILSALIASYDCTIHIRKPGFSFEAYKMYLQEYNHLLPHFVLHEHHSLAKEFPVKGIHLKERDRMNPKTPYPGIKIISTSIHSIEDVNNLKHPFEYIFFSPLFKSISKENYGTNTTEEQLTSTLLELKKRTNIPIIGLGGINEENIALVKKCGFDGAAVLGAVWESEDPVAAFGNCLRRNA